MNKFAGLFGLLLMGGCGGGEAEVDISGPWLFSAVHYADSCNTTIHKAYNNPITVSEEGKQVRFTGDMELGVVKLQSLEGRRSGSDFTLTGTGTKTVGGCQVNSTFSAKGLIRSTDTSGTLSEVSTLSPAGCAMEGYCPSVQYVFALFDQ